MSNLQFRAVAWVPDDDPKRPWTEAASLAARWIWEQSRKEGAYPVLVTNTFKNARDIVTLQEIAQRGGQITPQGKDRFRPSPVLAYVPDTRTLELAMEQAQGYSLAVVETKMFPLAEWAVEMKASNLLNSGTSEGPSL